MKIDYCYHTHTKRCGHAIGEDEEYVKAAIDNGIKVLGFSDHVMLPNIHQPHIRGDFDVLEDYINSINYLKEKYKDQIEIHLGLECEYMPHFLDYYRELKEKHGIEYLILGQHNYYDKETNNLGYYFYDRHNRQMFLNYANDVIDGIKSGLFAYVCHPDLFIIQIDEFDDFFIDLSRRICQAAEEYDVPLEINLGGWNYDRKMVYASEEFFNIARQYNVRFIVGYDVHNPNTFYHIKKQRLEAFAQKLDLKVINRLNLKNN